MRSLSQMIDENNLIFGFGALTDRNSKILEMPIQTRIALCFFTLKILASRAPGVVWRCRENKK